MFIARGIHQTQQSPSGATRASRIREVLFNARTQRRKDAEQRKRRKGTLPYLAPEGRHVYSTATCPSNQSPRGATCDSRIQEVLFNARTQSRKERRAEEKKEGDPAVFSPRGAACL